MALSSQNIDNDISNKIEIARSTNWTTKLPRHCFWNVHFSLLTIVSCFTSFSLSFMTIIVTSLEMIVLLLRIMLQISGSNILSYYYLH